MSSFPPPLRGRIKEGGSWQKTNRMTSASSVGRRFSPHPGLPPQGGKEQNDSLTRLQYHLRRDRRFCLLRRRQRQREKSGDEACGRAGEERHRVAAEQVIHHA